MGNHPKQAKMFTARQKIKKERGAQPNDLENQVAQAFVDLEINNEELRPTLKNLHIVAAREVRVNNSTAAIVVFVPYRLRELFRKNQSASCASLRRSSLANTLCSWPSARSRTRRSTPTARPPRARSALAPAPSPQSTMQSWPMLSTQPTSAPSAPATRWTATSKSKLSSKTDMKSARSSTPSPLCTLPSPARAPASPCLPQRSKLAV